MTKCGESCTPTCQHCIHAEYEQLELDGKVYSGEANGCKIHPDQGIDATYWCGDFYCFRVGKQAMRKLTPAPIRDRSVEKP